MTWKCKMTFCSNKINNEWRTFDYTIYVFLQLKICILTDREHTEHLRVSVYSLINNFSCMKNSPRPVLNEELVIRCLRGFLQMLGL